MTPASKEEIYLAKLCGESWELPYPASRLEYYYAKLCGMNVPLPAEPLSRPELYLAYLCGMDVKLPKPVSRKEMYMAKVCGIEVDKLPEPLSKAERYWIRITESKELTGIMPITLTSVGFYLSDYRIYGNSTQNNNTCISESSFCGMFKDNAYLLPLVCRSSSETERSVNISIGSEPLRKIGDSADYIDFHNQQIIRKISKCILTGNEFWTLYNGNYFSSVLDNTAQKMQGVLMASHFSTGTFNFHTGTIALKVISNNLENGINSVTEWKNYLNDQYRVGTPVTIWYILSESISSPCELPSISTFHGKNTITVQTDVVPSQMYIKYF